MWLLNVEMDASIRPSLLSVIMCTVYQVSVCSSPLGGDKNIVQNSSVESWGTLGNFIFSLLSY